MKWSIEVDGEKTDFAEIETRTITLDIEEGLIGGVMLELSYVINGSSGGVAHGVVFTNDGGKLALFHTPTIENTTWKQEEDCVKLEYWRDPQKRENLETLTFELTDPKNDS